MPRQAILASRIELMIGVCRVANELGAGHPKIARAAASMSVLLTLFVSAALAAVILAFRCAQLLASS